MKLSVALLLQLSSLVGMPALAVPTTAANSSSATSAAVRTVKPAVISYAMPKQVRPTATVTTWNEEEHTHQDDNFYWPRRDGYEAKITGVLPGTALHATVQAPSNKVQLPQRVRVLEGPSAERKQVNHDSNKALAAEVSKAVQEKPLFDTTADVSGQSKTVVVAKEGVLPTYAPITITGRDIYNRPTAKIHVTTQGLSFTQSALPNPYYLDGRWRTGFTSPVYEPWAKIENVFSTPVYARDGKTYTKILGLAAFPRNATVKLTNTRMLADGAPGHTVQLDKITKSGSASVEVPAVQGDRIEIELSYAANYDHARGAKTSYVFNVPMSSSKGEARHYTNTGLPYLPVKQVQ